VEAEWLLDRFSSEVGATEELIFDPQRRRVESVSRLTLGSLSLEESRLPAKPSPAVADLLFGFAWTQRAQLLGKDSKVDNLKHRLRLLAHHEPALGLPHVDEWDDAALLRQACAECTSFRELEEVDFASTILERLTPAQLQTLQTACPEHVQLATGLSLEVHYEHDKPPWVQARIQDFFGQDRTPRVVRGRVALTVHLLAPNKRPVQVTNDLESFWTRHYATVRKELRQRYPKHHWPEDGRVAEAPPPGKLRPLPSK
jgi:ATP-dependent helicase HrpB